MTAEAMTTDMMITGMTTGTMITGMTTATMTAGMITGTIFTGNRNVLLKEAAPGALPLLFRYLVVSYEPIK